MEMVYSVAVAAPSRPLFSIWDCMSGVKCSSHLRIAQEIHGALQHVIYPWGNDDGREVRATRDHSQGVVSWGQESGF